MDNPIQTQNSQGSWTETQFDELSIALTFAYKTQTTYKDPLDLVERLYGWKFVLEESYSVEQVLYGIKRFMKENTVMPVPADIHAILNPEPPKVTQASYIAAQAWLKNQDYPISAVADEKKAVIRDYEYQEREEKETYEIECDKIKAICSNSLKRIT